MIFVLSFGVPLRVRQTGIQGSGDDFEAEPGIAKLAAMALREASLDPTRPKARLVRNAQRDAGLAMFQHTVFCKRAPSLSFTSARGVSIICVICMHRVREVYCYSTRLGHVYWLPFSKAVGAQVRVLVARACCWQALVMLGRSSSGKTTATRALLRALCAGASPASTPAMAATAATAATASAKKAAATCAEASLSSAIADSHSLLCALTCTALPHGHPAHEEAEAMDALPLGASLAVQQWQARGCSCAMKAGTVPTSDTR
eukprot:2587135-Pleurochrysis_carterae.AAC.1